jgi:hypothetical protein
VKIRAISSFLFMQKMISILKTHPKKKSAGKGKKENEFFHSNSVTENS